MKTKSVISELVEELKNDEGYYQGWVANIAMSYMDNERWHKERTGKKYLNYEDRHTIANESAKYFIESLMRK